MGMLVVYADDDLDDVEIFQEVINNLNPDIKFIHVLDGAELIETLEQLVVLPDYIFLDLNMPKMDGRTCLMLLKKDNRFKEIPVIVYSTSQSVKDKSLAAKLGAQDYIVKPSRFKEAVTLLSSFFLKM